MTLPPLVAISPGDGDPVRFVIAMKSAGLPGVLIREPTVGKSTLEAAARAADGLWLAVHTRNPHALALGLPTHHPAHSPPPPPPPLDHPINPAPFGLSCHSAADLTRAFALGATWAMLSPVFPPASKPADDRPPIGESEFLQITAGRPVFALGGITADRLHRLIDAGALGGMVFGFRAIEVWRGISGLGLGLGRGQGTPG